MSPGLSSVRNVLLACDGDAAAAATARYAGSLATFLGAGLTGAASALPTLVSYSPLGDALPAWVPDVQEAARNAMVASLSKAEAIFRSSCGVAAAEWKSSTRIAGEEFLLQCASEADLLVVPKPPSSGERTLFSVDASALVLGAGRPVLLAPRGTLEFSNARVLVAWKETREARRALSDALPLLCDSDEVVLAAVSSALEPPGLEAAARFLEGHGIVVTRLHEPQRARRDGEALLEIAQRVGATLMVSGAYGQSRFRAWVLGGVTRELMENASVPCLMSH